MSPTPTTARDAVSEGRHSSDRRVGFCQTLSISSGAVLLRLKDALSGLGPIELSIRWPFRMNGSVPLKLMARGQVVRVAGHSIAVEVAEYEFHTSGHEQLKKPGRE